MTFVYLVKRGRRVMVLPFLEHHKRVRAKSKRGRTQAKEKEPNQNQSKF
jgi:hypothetical protein